MFFEFRMRKQISPHSPLAFLFLPCYFPFIFVSSSSPFPLPFIWVSFSKDGHMTSVKRGWAKAAKRVYVNVCQNSADTTLYYGPIFNSYKDMLPSLNITVFFFCWHVHDHVIFYHRKLTQTRDGTGQRVLLVQFRPYLLHGLKCTLW